MAEMPQETKAIAAEVAAAADAPAVSVEVMERQAPTPVPSKDLAGVWCSFFCENLSPPGPASAGICFAAPGCVIRHEKKATSSDSDLDPGLVYYACTIGHGFFCCPEPVPIGICCPIFSPVAQQYALLTDGWAVTSSEPCCKALKGVWPCDNEKINAANAWGKEHDHWMAQQDVIFTSCYRCKGISCGGCFLPCGACQCKVLPNLGCFFSEFA